MYQRHQKGKLGEHTNAPPAMCSLQGVGAKSSPPISVCPSQSLGYIGILVPLWRQEAYLNIWIQGQTQGHFTETKSLRLKNTFPLLCWCSSTPISMEISTPFLDSVHAKTAPPNPKLKLLMHIFYTWIISYIYVLTIHLTGIFFMHGVYKVNRWSVCPYTTIIHVFCWRKKGSKPFNTDSIWLPHSGTM